jgi:hypothetical protein
MTPMTFGGKETVPIWSPDGRFIVYGSQEGLSWMRADARIGPASPNCSSERKISWIRGPSPPTETGWRTTSWIPKPRLTSGPCLWRTTAGAFGLGNPRSSFRHRLTSGILPSLRTGTGWRMFPTSRETSRFMSERSPIRVGSGRFRTPEVPIRCGRAADASSSSSPWITGSW